MLNADESEERTISGEPVGVVGVEAHRVLPESETDGSGSHGRSRVTSLVLDMIRNKTKVSGLAVLRWSSGKRTCCVSSQASTRTALIVSFSTSLCATNKSTQQRSVSS